MSKVLLVGWLIGCLLFAGALGWVSGVWWPPIVFLALHLLGGYACYMWVAESFWAGFFAWAFGLAAIVIPLFCLVWTIFYWVVVLAGDVLKRRVR